MEMTVGRSGVAGRRSPPDTPPVARQMALPAGRSLITPAGRFPFHVIGAIDETRAALLTEGTQERLDAARACGRAELTLTPPRVAAHDLLL
jgi:hypothetical protein